MLGDEVQVQLLLLLISGQRLQTNINSVSLLLLIVICNIFVLLSLEINNEAQFRQSNDRPDRIQ